MKKELIEEINGKCPYNQGIFVEGFMVPNHIKEACVYTRYDIGGMTGGSCWGRENLHYEKEEPPKDRYKVLDLVLAELKPDITYLQYREIEALWDYRDQTFDDYYGNTDETRVEFLILSELEEYLNTI